MMKRLIAISALLSAVALQPAAAQPVAPVPANSAEAELICVAWIANAADSAKTEKEKFGMISLLTYFVGKWEGATGRSIEDGLTFAFISANLSKIEGAKADCLARAGEFGRRLQVVGTRLQNSGKDK